MFDVTKISYAPEDILIFAVNVDTYNVEECENIFKSLKKQAPDVEIIFIPDDFIDKILVLNKQLLAYDTNTLTITNPSAYPNAYLTNIMNSESTAGVHLTTEGETKTW